MTKARTRDDFLDEELTTRAVRSQLQDQEQEDARVASRTRRSGARVEDPRKVSKSHTTPAQQARGSQNAKRENPPAWRPAALLDAPPAPAGMVLRWIRVKQGVNDDPAHFSRKFREGWRPYLIKDAPEDYIPPETAKTRLGEAIAIADLLLCIMPREQYKQRQEHYRKKRERQTTAVRNKFRSQEDSRLPIEAEYRQTATKKRKPNPADFAGDDE